MTGPGHYAEKARRHARNATIWAWVSVGCAVVAVVNAILVTLGVY